jgi:signal transduction histidine kinase
LKGLSLSLKGAVSTGEGKELIRQMNVTVKKLDQLASDLVEAGGISDGSLPLNRRRTDLEALVSRVVSEADGISEVDVRMDLEPASASVDPARLQQILDGVLNHARERTGASGTIRIRLTGDEDGGTIAVDDEGEPSSDVGPQLLLAARLAELHGGRLWSEPRMGGGGSSVKVFLPADPDLA